MDFQVQMKEKGGEGSMALIRWNPWSLERFLDEDIDFPTIPGVSKIMGQGLNIYETEEAIVAEAAVPGVPEDRIDVTIDDGIVRITGSFEESQEDKRKRKYFMSSFVSSFNYAFKLPEGVAKDKEPVVEFENGMLRLAFPKIKKQAPKKIRISTKEKELKAK